MTLDQISDTLRQYQIDALKTALKTEPGKDLLIRSCGLAGEWAEFLNEPTGLPVVAPHPTLGGLATLPTSRGEELADVFWYAAAVADLMGVQLADLALAQSYSYDPPQAEKYATIAIGAVCEYAKKVGGHGRAKPVEDLTKHLSKALGVILLMAGDSLPILLAANVAKLRARHASAGPGGFDPNYGKPLAPTLAEALSVVVTPLGKVTCNGDCGTPCSKCGAEFGGACSGTGNGTQCPDGERNCECA